MALVSYASNGKACAVPAGPTSLVSSGDELLELIFGRFSPLTAMRMLAVPSNRMRRAGPVGYDVIHPGDRNALSRLCLVSRRFKRIATPLLYRDLICLQPRQTERPATALRLLECFNAHPESTAFRHVKTLGIRHCARHGDKHPDFRALVAACTNVEVLHVEGPNIGELFYDAPSGRILGLPKLQHITAGTVVNWSAPVWPFLSTQLPSCLQRTTLRSLNLLGCEASTLRFLQSPGTWSSLERLGLAAPGVSEGCRIVFACLPSLKHLAIDGSLQGYSPENISLLDEGLPPTVETLDLAAFTIEDMRTIVALFSGTGSGCSIRTSLILDFVALVRALYHEGNREGIDLVFELGRRLETASIMLPFRLLPENVISETERYSRALYGHWLS